jgi:hypothetical protein
MVTREVCFRKARCVKCALNIIQPSTAHARENLRTLRAVRRQPLRQLQRLYNLYLRSKDLKRSFFALWEKVITSKS